MFRMERVSCTLTTVHYTPLLSYLWHSVRLERNDMGNDEQILDNTTIAKFAR